ncbi:MAG: hypothetical protein NT080_00350 [Spirochaetes bacterium]|nr:hypothetical protein [Spirochaetota bacterium]
MSIVTVATFKKYAKKMDDDVVGEALYQSYVDAAESIIADFLSYSPVMTSYTHTFYGDGDSYLALKAKPVTLGTITVDGVAKTLTDFLVEDEVITEKNGNSFPTGSVVIVGYLAGYTTVPGVFQVVILEIASLLSMEAGENIGVNSTTFDGGNTRSFTNYTNFSKYLAKVEKYRIRRLPRAHA